MEDSPQVVETPPNQFQDLPATVSQTVGGVALEPVPLATFRAQSPVPVSLYLRLDEDMVLCRRQGELLDTMLRRHLLEVGKDRLWTPASSRHRYLQHLRETVVELVMEVAPDQNSGEDSFSWLDPWLSTLNRSTQEQIERAWRTAFYGVRLAESAGLDEFSLVREIALGLLLHELEEIQSMTAEGQKLGVTAASIIDGCHERIDGQGPRSWGPAQLSLPVRIACVAVAFDRKTTGADDRLRQPAFDALRDFIVNDHGALDPRVIAGFIRILDR